MSAPRFRPPARAIYDELGGEYFGDTSYATYNYLRGGLADRVKTLHFDAALKYCDENGLAGGSAVDMGCADGVFLPSLDQRFASVTGLDIRPAFVEGASAVIDRMGLSNTTVHCTAGMDWDAVIDLAGAGRHDVVFLLETLEHIGERERFYESKVDFLQQLARMLKPGGRIVMSVPNMVGLSLLVQRAVLRLGRRYREPISTGDLLRGVVLRDVSKLEATWTNDDHLGFNHRVLERHLRDIGVLEVRRNLGFTVFSVLRPNR